MRLPRSAALGSLLVLLAGCGAAAQKGPNESAPMRDPEGKMGSASSRSSVIWGVRSFDEKPQWLAAQPALKESEGTWGEKIAVAVERALDARRVDARVIPDGVTPAQMDTLFRDGLQYLCEGTLSSVAVTEGNGTLRVAYRLKRRIGEDTRTVQARVIEGSAKTAVLDDAALQALVTAAAEKIADAVIADVPADLLAIRG
jgi:hypothetical protein